MSSGEGWESVSQPTMPTLQDDLLEKLLGVANRAKSFTSAGGAAIALGSGKHFVVSVTCGTSLDVGATVPLPSTLAGFRSLKSNALRYGDTDKEATIDGSVCRSARIKSMLVVPVGDLSDVRAVLAVFSSAVNAFTETHVAVLKTLAEVIGNLLPEKAKSAETAPEKKTGELLEHPFDPSFDNLPKKVEVGSSPLNELSEPASAVLDSAMRAPRASLSPPVPPPAVEVLAGGDAYTNPAPAPPRVPKPPPAKASTPPTGGWRGPNASEALNLAADPVVKRSSSAVAPARKRISPRPSTGRVYKSRSYKTFFVVAVASLAIVALLRLGYGYFLNRYMNTSEIVRTTVPSAAPPEHRQLASPFGTRTEHLGQTKGDVVGAATAASFSPTTNPIAIDSVPPQAVESRTLKPLRLDPIVVRQSSAPPPAALFKPQEERLPEVHVASTPAMVSEILRTSTPVVSAPTFKVSTVVPSELVSKVAPTYPEGAKRFGIRGKVVISARVTKTGSVTDVSAVSGPPLLQDAAISAVKKWRYKPSTSDGKPIDSKVEIVI